MAQIIWITGRPGVGKTTLGKEICRRYENHILLDADELRRAFNFQGFTEADRCKWVGSVAKLAHMLMKQGFNPVVAMVSPYAYMRTIIFSNLFNKRDVTLIYLPGGEDRMWEGSVYQEPSSSEAGRYLERKYRI